MATHQKMSEYTGGMYIAPKPSTSPANDFVVGTGGGLSTIHHHPTQGFYGAGNMSYDIYAGQPPHNLQGIEGNVYSKGETSTQTRGYYSTEGYETIDAPPQQTPTASLESSGWSFGLMSIVFSIGLFLVSYSIKDEIMILSKSDTPLVLLISGLVIMLVGYLGELMK